MDDEATSQRLASLPTWRLANAARRSHRILTDALAAVGARGFDYRVLVAVEEHGPCSQIVIGRAADLDRSDVVAVVRRLEEQGALVRRTDAIDQRRNVVELTDAGRSLLTQLDGIVSDVQRDVFGSLSAKQLRQLLAMLDSISADE